VRSLRGLVKKTIGAKAETQLLVLRIRMIGEHRFHRRRQQMPFLQRSKHVEARTGFQSDVEQDQIRLQHRQVRYGRLRVGAVTACEPATATFRTGLPDHRHPGKSVPYRTVSANHPRAERRRSANDICATAGGPRTSVDVTAPRTRVRFNHPQVREYLARVQIRNLRLGAAVVDPSLERHQRDVGANVLNKAGEVEVSVIL